VKEAFKAQYPKIDVEVERSGSERVLQRINQEYQSGIHNVDVVNSSDASHFIFWKEQKWLAKHVPPEAAKFPANGKDPEGYFFAWRSSLSPIAYNTNLVKEADAPKSYKDLLDPKWKGKLTKAHPGYSGTALTGTFEFIVRTDMKLALPRAEKPDAWITMGFDEDLDDIVGILHVRDLFSALHDRGMDRVDLRSILRTAIVVPETKHLDELLTEFQTTSNHMAIVIDEYGSVEGLVTLEDLLEEIVGEIGDEFDRPDAGILRIGRGRVRIGGSFPIDEFNERFGTNVPDDDYHTVGGFVFGELGRAPKVGDSIGFDGARFEVSSTDGPRIIEVDVTLSAAGAPAGENEGEGQS